MSGIFFSNIDTIKCIHMLIENFVIFKAKKVVRECLESAKGHGYKGTANETRTGLPCQRWDSQSPHSHKWGSLGSEGNNCRNPDNGRLPWCYTTSADSRWDYCDIPLCGKNFVPTSYKQNTILYRFVS